MSFDHPIEFDTTPGNNTHVKSISVEENVMVMSAVNNVMRAQSAIMGQTYRDLGGVNTVGGDGDTITVGLTGTFAALENGIHFRFIPNADNTGAATINVTPNGGSALGAKAVRKISGGTDVALAAGDLLDGKRAFVVYDEDANSPNGAWILDNPASVAFSEVVDDTTPQLGGDLDLNSNDITGTGNFDITGTGTFTSTDDSSVVLEAVVVDWNSSSPADGDQIDAFALTGRNDAAETVDMFNISVSFDDVSDGTEESTAYFSIMDSGSFTSPLRISSSGVTTTSNFNLPTGGVIKWGSSDVTLTHSSNTLTVNDGTVLESSAYNTSSSSGNGYRLNSLGFIDMQRPSGTGASAAIYRYMLGTSPAFVVRGDGDCENTNNSYTGLSDARIKEIDGRAGSQFDDIMAFELYKGRITKRIDENGNIVARDVPTGTQLFLIAQQVREISPGLVKEDENGQLSLKYSIVNLKLLGAFQEHVRDYRAYVEKNEAEKVEMRERIAALEANRAA